MVKTIVWIEDDIDIIDSVVELIERDGHNIIRLRSIHEALENIELIRNSDLILLDIIIPPGNQDIDFPIYSGTKLLEILRNEHNVETPTIVLSVVDSRSEHNKLHQLGIRQILPKPVLPLTLKEEVEKLFSNNLQ